MGHDNFVHESPQFTNILQFSMARRINGLTSMGVSVLRHIPFMLHMSTNYDIVTSVPEAECLVLFGRQVYVKILSL